ncbi:MAG: hypothetical protein IKS23_03215 [Alphaproteobacteria bacterium]|nr:hypothetical protein [Alphaproteobacteria bacterium]
MKKLLVLLACVAGFCFSGYAQNTYEELIAEYELKYEAAQKEFSEMTLMLDDEKWAYVKAQATCLSYETMVAIGERCGLDVKAFRKKANKLQKRLNRNKIELSSEEEAYARAYYKMSIYFTAKATLERALDLQK